MANSVATVTVIDEWHDTKREHVTGTVALSNFNYITNGIPVPWTGQEFIKSATNPVYVTFTGIGGFLYGWDYTNLTIRIFKVGAISSTPSPNAALLEETGGSALTSGISTDSIRFYAIFKLI